MNVQVLIVALTAIVSIEDPVAFKSALKTFVDGLGSMAGADLSDTAPPESREPTTEVEKANKRELARAFRTDRPARSVMWTRDGRAVCSHIARDRIGRQR